MTDYLYSPTDIALVASNLVRGSAKERWSMSAYTTYGGLATEEAVYLLDMAANAMAERRQKRFDERMRASG